jgi:hypothetical protein
MMIEMIAGIVVSIIAIMSACALYIQPTMVSSYNNRERPRDTDRRQQIVQKAQDAEHILQATGFLPSADCLDGANLEWLSAMFPEEAQALRVPYTTGIPELQSVEQIASMMREEIQTGHLNAGLVNKLVQAIDTARLINENNEKKGIQSQKPFLGMFAACTEIYAGPFWTMIRRRLEQEAEHEIQKQDTTTRKSGFQGKSWYTI